MTYLKKIPHYERTVHERNLFVFCTRLMRNKRFNSMADNAGMAGMADKSFLNSKS